MYPSTVEVPDAKKANATRYTVVVAETFSRIIGTGACCVVELVGMFS